MNQQSGSINANTIYSGTTSGVAFKSFSIGNSSTTAVPSSRFIYANFIQPCVGGFGVFHPDVTDNISTYSNPSSSIVPLIASVAWPTGFGAMTDDMAFLEAFDTLSVPTCGRRFALPYFIGASDGFSLISQVTNSSYFVNGQPYPFQQIEYGATVNRDFTISAMRGIDEQGEEVQII
jgi:hypothetical protein